MAIGTPVTLGTATNGVGSTTTLTTTAAVAAGDLIIAVIYVPDATQSLSTVTDTAGNTYVIDVSKRHTTDTARYIAIASCLNAIAMAAGGTITWTTTGSVSGIKGVTAATVSGVAASSALDKTSTNDGSSTTWSTGSSGTLSQADEIAFGLAFSLQSATSNTPDAGWTELADFSPQSGRRLVLEHQVVSATTALNAGGTVGNAVWVGALATYKAAAARGAQPILRRPHSGLYMRRRT